MAGEDFVEESWRYWGGVMPLSIARDILEPFFVLVSGCLLRYEVAGDIWRGSLLRGFVTDL